MTFEIGLLLALVAAALVLFSVDWVPADVVAMGLLLALTVTGLLPARQAFAGFGSDTVIMILSLLILTAALVDSGVVDLVGRALLSRFEGGTNVMFLAIIVAVAGLSAFISNTAATAFFVPVVIGLATKAKLSPSRFLMPVAFASILTSSVALISTSTNLVVNGLMTNAGLAPMRMFELAPVGVPIALVGLAYMFFIGRRWVPERAEASGPFESFGMRSYLSEVLVLPESRLVGKTLRESKLGSDLDLVVVRVVRGEGSGESLMPTARLIIRAGDVLIVEGAREEVLKVKDTAGVEIRPEVQLSDPFLSKSDAAVVEALVVPGSPLVGRSLRRIGFRERFGLQVLGVNRHGKNLLSKLSRVILRAGDVLLIQGRKRNITRIDEARVISVLGQIEEKRPDPGRALRAGLIFVGTLTLATLNVLPLAVAGFLGAFLTFVTRCITPADAYREVDWRVIILIACMLALGAAMQETGAALYLAHNVVSLASGHSPLWLLGGFFVLTVALTQPMSNQAAAAVILPIAVSTAQNLQLDPRPFAMMIAVAASCSYLTPLEPACLMVYGPGRYRFFDFVRVGGPLVLVIFALALWMVPKIWPLQGL